MQQTSSMKRFALDHIGAAALAFAILVGGVAAVTTLALTHDQSPFVSSPSEGSVAAPVTREGRAQLAMERDEFRNWETSQNVAIPSGSDLGAATRQLTMERDEYSAWRTSQNAPRPAGSADASTRQLTMERNEYREWRANDASR